MHRPSSFVSATIGPLPVFAKPSCRLFSRSCHVGRYRPAQKWLNDRAVDGGKGPGQTERAYLFTLGVAHPQVRSLTCVRPGLKALVVRPLGEIPSCRETLMRSA